MNARPDRTEEIEANLTERSTAMFEPFVQELSEAQARLENATAAGLRLAPAVKAIRRTVEHILAVPRLAITGELNAGKSSLANALIGGETLPTAALSNTRLPTLTHYAEIPAVNALLSTGEKRALQGAAVESTWDIQFLEVGLPSPRLRELEILDVPGLSDPRLRNTSHRPAMLGADVIFWCTSGIQAWRESERGAWMSLPPHVRARGVLVVTRKDQLRRIEDQASVLTRLKREAGGLFQGVLLVSSTRAREARASIDPEAAKRLWDLSGLDQLELMLAELVSAARLRKIAKAKRVTRRTTALALSRIERAGGFSG